MAGKKERILERISRFLEIRSRQDRGPVPAGCVPAGCPRRFVSSRQDRGPVPAGSVPAGSAKHHLPSGIL